MGGRDGGRLEAGMEGGDRQGRGRWEVGTVGICDRVRQVMVLGLRSGLYIDFMRWWMMAGGAAGWQRAVAQYGDGMQRRMTTGAPVGGDGGRW